MKITAAVVARIGQHAHTYTLGAFRYQDSGQDIGRGVRYFGNQPNQMWVGRGASRQAAAYYIGAMLGWAQATDTPIPDDIRQDCRPVQEAYSRDPNAMHWEEQGRRDGRVLAGMERSR